MEESDGKRLNIREECCHTVPEDTVWLKEHKLVCGHKVVWASREVYRYTHICGNIHCITQSHASNNLLESSRKKKNPNPNLSVTIPESYTDVWSYFQP